MYQRKKPKYYEKYKSYRGRQNNKGHNTLNFKLSHKLIACSLILLLVILPVILKDTWVGKNKAFLEKVFLTHITFDDVKEVAGKIFTKSEITPVVSGEDNYTLDTLPAISLPVIGQLAEETTADKGVIITAPEGYPVVAVLEGKVLAVRQANQSMEVEIDHGKGLTTIYTYLQAVAIKPNEEIQQGTIIGYTGKFNNTSGVSFTIRLNGKVIDTKNILAGK
ncbi:M23 family metallopeptidase [Clostridium sp. 'deep sea']|uniref:M23 family metallopeptidase n=1 Tax=Clostridium sp. 'deep sea' TaxID=2779445 RepID=UPI0018969F67|nr:M23 family metallopeptidase [Clostridium sp. 'deep sea']QOR36334.1 M23 family metallopeptidase [Clostridium sp. 'deep sea']